MAKRTEGCEPCGTCPACIADGRAHLDARRLRKDILALAKQLTTLASEVEGRANTDLGDENLRERPDIRMDYAMANRARRVRDRVLANLKRRK